MMETDERVREFLEHWKAAKCRHLNFDYDSREAELHENGKLSLKIFCLDCGAKGWEWYQFQETEWDG